MQLGGGTKELYYYPSGTALVTVVDENANPSKATAAERHPAAILGALPPLALPAHRYDHTGTLLLQSWCCAVGRHGHMAPHRQSWCCAGSDGAVLAVMALHMQTWCCCAGSHAAALAVAR